MKSGSASERARRGAKGAKSLLPRVVLLVVIWVLAWGEVTVVNVIVGRPSPNGSGPTTHTSLGATTRCST